MNAPLVPLLADVPAQPVLALTVTGDGRAFLDGVPVEVPGGADPRVVVADAAIARARGLGRPVRAVLHDAQAQRWRLLLTPEGGVFQSRQPLQPQRTWTERPTVAFGQVDLKTLRFTRVRRSELATAAHPVVVPEALDQPRAAEPSAAAPVDAESKPGPAALPPAAVPEPAARPDPHAAPRPLTATPVDAAPALPEYVDPATVPAWPHVSITLDKDGVVTVNDVPVAIPPGADPRQEGVAAAAAHIRGLGLSRPVRASATEPDGTIWPLVIHPDGVASGAGDPIRPQRRRRWFRRRH